MSRYEENINPSQYINSLKYPATAKYSQKYSISVATEKINPDVLEKVEQTILMENNKIMFRCLLSAVDSNQKFYMKLM